MKLNTSNILSIVTIIFAIIFAIIYLWAAFQLYQAFGSVSTGDEKLWDHAWSIFTGIQSAGLSAIGVLLGVAVQQPRVADAQAQTQKAKGAIDKVLSTNRSAAEKGGALVSEHNKTTLTDEMHATLLEGLRA